MLEMYNKFAKRIVPVYANDLLFTRVMPELVIPYFAREYRSKIRTNIFVTELLHMFKCFFDR